MQQVGTCCWAQLPCACVASREHSLGPQTETAIKLRVFLPWIWAGILYPSLPGHTDRLLESAPLPWCLCSVTSQIFCLNLKEVPVHSKLCSPGALASRRPSEEQVCLTHALLSRAVLPSLNTPWWADTETEVIWVQPWILLDFPFGLLMQSEQESRIHWRKTHCSRQGRAKRVALYLSWPLICIHRTCKV